MTWLQAHEYMTSAELGRTFQVDHPDDGEFDPLLINCWRSVKMPLWPDVRKKGIEWRSDSPTRVFGNLTRN